MARDHKSKYIVEEWLELLKSDYSDKDAGRRYFIII